MLKVAAAYELNILNVEQTHFPTGPEKRVGEKNFPSPSQCHINAFGDQHIQKHPLKNPAEIRKMNTRQWWKKMEESFSPNSCVCLPGCLSFSLFLCLSVSEQNAYECPFRLLGITCHALLATTSSAWVLSTQGIPNRSSSYFKYRK